MIKKLEDMAIDQDDLAIMESVKGKLYDLLLVVYHSVDAEIAKELKYYKLRFVPEKQAKERILDKYHPEILNDERETELVVNFRDICAVSGMPNSDPAFIDYLAIGLTPFMSLAYEESEIDVNNDYVQRLIKPLMAYEVVRRLITPEEEILQDFNKKQEDNQAIQTRKIIESQFYYKGEIDWAFAFRQEKDFNLFVSILTKSFTGEEYHLCDTISLKSGSKTRLARILRNIHKELSEDSLRSDKKYFKIVSVLSPYKNVPDLYKTLTK